MSTEHSPGPWTVKRSTVRGEQVLYVTAADPETTSPVICRVYHNREANAYLLAAAPKLLAACEALEAASADVIEWFCATGLAPPPGLDAATNRASKAIAKARKDGDV